MSRAVPIRVEFEDVRMSFDGEAVLDGVTLSLPPGRTTVLLGPSGVGKTTLVRTLLGLYRPDSGATRVDDRAVADLPEADLAALRRSSGVLLGGASVYDASLFGSMSVFDNVAYPLRATGTPEPEAARRAWAVLHEFGLAEHADQPPSELAGGARRRAALARALVGEPRLLVLDDPGPAIDLHNRDEIARVIARHQRRSGATALIVTHDVELARLLGDHAAVLADGTIVAQGPPEEVFRDVRSADDLTERFGLDVGPMSPGYYAAMARRVRRQGRAEDWLLMAVLMVMLTMAAVVVGSGMLANPAI